MRKQIQEEEMSGCYGNSPEDRYFESKLLDHLDNEWQCSKCGGHFEMGGYEIHGEMVCDDCAES